MNNSNNFVYCGVKNSPRTPLNSSKFHNHNPLGSDRTYESLGDKIFRMIETGEDIGEKINPMYDGNETDDLDVTKSFRHDPMDIAEEFGKLPEQTPAPLPEEGEEKE